jgi:HYD1 signature containing ADP-ribosyltransferase
LYHYSTVKGHAEIVSSETLRPSLKAVNPRDARFGDGQYLSDILPGTKSPGQLAFLFLNDPRGWRRFTREVV